MSKRLTLSSEEIAVRQRLKDDFGHYSAKCLKIRTKSGAVEPLVLNKAQRYVHKRLEAQRTRTGKVRSLVLKGRQQGISTYIGARYYWRVTHRRGLRVFILTHEQTATDNLFGMANRYHEHCPALVKPSTGAANAKELFFDALDGGYEVGTAGTKAVGRSKTIQLFHGSEVGFWPHAASHFASVIQAIPDLPDTEIVLESTANGLGGEFHERWQQAEAGIGDYEAIFVPWFWQDEYARPVDDDFILDDEEANYAETYELSREQIAWRRAKIAELKDPLLFKQEYPATAAEAFQTTGHDSFIKAETVLAARKASLSAYGPLVAGADPARFGDDRFSIALRQGRKLISVNSKSKLDVVQGANWCREVIDLHRPAKMFIDVGGLGAGVVDILKSWGAPYDRIVVAVNFGGAPFRPKKMDREGKPMAGPRNRRAEMWSDSKDWLEDVGGADIPDRDGLQADACGPSYRYDVNQRLQLESKEDMRARGVRSPDEWDAVVLTFAEPVSDRMNTDRLVLPNFGAV
jgi:hypothetical protein